jgi:hypothetical protein
MLGGKMAISQDDLKLRQVCHECTKDENGTFAGSWVQTRCLELGVPFSQAGLGKLVRESHLVKEDSSRGGKRRYYRLAEPGPALLGSS